MALFTAKKRNPFEGRSRFRNVKPESESETKPESKLEAANDRADSGSRPDPLGPPPYPPRPSPPPEPSVDTAVRETAGVQQEDVTAEQPSKRGRGRPRPQATIDRDEAVFALLMANPDGISKTAIAEALQEKEQQVYSSLRQLAREGRAENRYGKDVGYRWSAREAA